MIKINKDLVFLKKAIEKSKESVKRGGYPVGAALVMDGKIISYGFSDGKNLKDATSHAEIDAIRKASKRLLTINNWVNKIKIVYLRQMRRHGGEKIRSCIGYTARIFSPNGKQVA